MSRAPDSPVTTGLEDDGRRRWLRVSVGVLGWLLLVAAIVYLASNPSLVALDVAVFLVTAVTVFTLIAVLAGLQLRGDLMKERMTVPEKVFVDSSHDSLGRPVDPPGQNLTGEIVLDTVDGRRRYVESTR